MMGFILKICGPSCMRLRPVHRKRRANDVVFSSKDVVFHRKSIENREFRKRKPSFFTAKLLPFHRAWCHSPARSGYPCTKLIAFNAKCIIFVAKLLGGRHLPKLSRDNPPEIEKSKPGKRAGGHQLSVDLISRPFLQSQQQRTRRLRNLKPRLRLAGARARREVVSERWIAGGASGGRMSRTS